MLLLIFQKYFFLNHAHNYALSTVTLFSSQRLYWRWYKYVSKAEREYINE